VFIDDGTSSILICIRVLFKSTVTFASNNKESNVSRTVSLFIYVYLYIIRDCIIYKIDG